MKIPECDKRRNALIARESAKRRNALIARESAKPGLRGKVNAFCIHCIFDPEGGGGSWRQQVEDCTAPSCPLYDVRPTTVSREQKEPKAA